MIGETIKKLLEEKGMSQKELADAIGVTEATMSRYISGQREVKIGAAVKIAKVLIGMQNRQSITRLKKKRNVMKK